MNDPCAATKMQTKTPCAATEIYMLQDLIPPSKDPTYYNKKIPCVVTKDTTPQMKDPAYVVIEDLRCQN